MKAQETFEQFIKYETALSELFRELELKPNLCQLIRAFILVSNGETVFEASFSDLGAVFTKKKPTSRSDTNARNAFKSLEEWQEQNELQLIRVIKKGQRISTDIGHQYVKSQYEFVILNDLVKMLYTSNENLDSVIQESIIKIKAKYKPVEKIRSYNPNHLIRKAKNTIYTKFMKIFELSIQAGTSPIENCQIALNESSKIVDEINDKWEKAQNRDNFMKNFEERYQ